jgi:predicted enzyme related to lactoylglutathione lyase
MNLNSILIGSEDPGRLVEFYTKLFGEPGWNDSGYTGWLIGSGALTVGPHSEVKGKNAHPGRIIWNIETPEVLKEYERFKAAGAPVIHEPYDPAEEQDVDEAGMIATFADPDDNYFQLMSPMGPPE